MNRFLVRYGCGFLRFSAGSCEHLRFSARIYASQMLCFLGEGENLQNSAKMLGLSSQLCPLKRALILGNH